MMHAFTAGAWNPALMKAGFAAMVTDGLDPDGMTAEGSLDCEKLADETRAEIVALQGVSLLMKLIDEGPYVIVHTTDPDVHARVTARPGSWPVAEVYMDGMLFYDYFNDGTMMHILPPSKSAETEVFKKSMAAVQEMACAKSGQGIPENTEGNA